MMSEKLKETIERVIVRKGPLLGKNLAIFAGVHGNESVGLEAIRDTVRDIRLKRGAVYFVEANPRAIDKNVRLIGKNLNRCFFEGNDGTVYEDGRARELMTLLDSCDALLDIHSSNSKETTPFVICEPNALAIAESFEFPIISFGWDALEPGGADGYMFRSGKVGICIECGSVFDPGAGLPLAKQAIQAFLSHYDMLEAPSKLSTTSHRYIRVHSVGHKQTENLHFTLDYRDFAPLEPGETFATDGETIYKAERGDCIIFPRPNASLGSEAFILGKEIPPPVL